MRHCPRIALIEDDVLLAELTCLRLEWLGYRVRVLNREEGILDELRRERPDLVLIDLEFGEQGGLPIITALGEDEATRYIPVMALSMDSDLETAQRAFRAGAIEFLAAPFSPSILEAKVEQLAALAGRTH